ncbi:MAG: sigma-54 factor interaction domain-containing protein [Terracidiphilus sp.]|nr:sigma-54 factor interaction domain-containing protein [Terracidiphilus sp.]
MALIEAAGCDVLLIDLPSDSLFLKKRIEIAARLIKCSVSAVVIADSSLQSAAFELVSQGAFGQCRRPVATRELRSMLERASEATQLQRELRKQQHKTDTAANCDRLIGSSTAIRQVYQLVHRVANLNATVLINGESGTGKELIARAIHKLGSRSRKPFVAVSCGAIPETLIEAELFGHEKGAFTGTVGAREGYFEQAADGTLFLDEIGDLSLYTQVKLLRVLQQMEFSRLGSTRLIPLRARLIFATHQDLTKLVEESKFRQDLY